MTKHPADPRSDALGELPFDPNEYPAVVYTPPPPPPEVGNVHAFVAYRGQVDHGVPFEESGAGFMPYLHEAVAQGRYVDPEVTPRDVEPIVPVKVEIVSNPTFIEPKRIRVGSITIAPSTSPLWIAVVQPEKFRKRCVVTVMGSAGGTAQVRISNSPDAITVNSALMMVSANSQTTAIDTESQDGFWVWNVSSTDPTITVSYFMEYYDYDGSKLL